MKLVVAGVPSDLCGRGQLGIWVFVLSIAGYAAIAPFPVILDAPSRYFSVPFRIVIVAAAGFVILRHLLSRPSFHLDWFWLLFLGFWFLFFTRVIVDGLLNPSALRLTSPEYLMMGIGMCALPAMAVALKSSPTAFDRGLIWLWVVGACGLGANFWLITTELESGGLAMLLVSRQFTETLNPISFGALGASLVLSSVWSYVHQRPRSTVFKVARALALLLGFAAVVAGASRGPIISLIVVAPLIFMARVRLHRNTSRLLRLMFLFSVGGLFLIAGILFLDLESMALIRRFDKGLFEDSARIQLYSDAWALILRDVFFGAGVEPLGWYPHNLILESFLLNGIVSGVIFLWMFLYAVAKALHGVLVGAANSWVSLLFLQYAVGTMFSFSIYSSVQFWVLMAAVIGMSRARKTFPAPVGVSQHRA